MFGYIVTNRKTLSKAEILRYKSAYCGLCRHLRLAYGNAGRSALSYDMAFVALLLSALYELPEEAGQERCLASPARRHPYIATEATAYAADMNIMLAYYQALDDWNDERSQPALAASRRLAEFLPAIGERWPVQTECAARCMGKLAEIEKGNELNPDAALNCFGELMGGLLAWRQDGHEASLRRIGAALGRFVYLLDANNDLADDIRNERYNPLVALPRADFKPLLALVIGECAAEFESLRISRDIHLLRNVIYSGVWLKYRPSRGRAGG
ncbi:MAG: DUF5685 family protein [Clostridiales bacterium]|jgi:hypothetical protein|nr:DUF5685 family protein [Clostridiales bacterium]